MDVQSMNYSSTSARAEVVTKEAFKELPKDGPDFLIDATKIQAHQDALKQQTRRWQPGFFRVPVDASGMVKKQSYEDAIGKWIGQQSRQGWLLDSGVHVRGPFKAFDESGIIPLLGIVQYEVRAVFNWDRTRSVQNIRIPINPAVVRQDPEHRLTLKEAIKAWGINPQKLHAQKAGR